MTDGRLKKQLRPAAYSHDSDTNQHDKILRSDFLYHALCMCLELVKTNTE